MAHRLLRREQEKRCAPPFRRDDTQYDAEKFAKRDLATHQLEIIGANIITYIHTTQRLVTRAQIHTMQQAKQNCADATTMKRASDALRKVS